MAKPETVPVTILTGFLGSGKTTLLNRLLRDPDWSDSAVVVNEFGDIGLDHLLVAGASDTVVVMDGGCLCCAVIDDLPQTLTDLFHRRAQGSVPLFRRLLVETSGLAEPAPIMRSLMRDPVISHFYRLRGVVCAVDAVFGAATLAAEHEAVTQVEMADRVAVTKTDLTARAIPKELAATLTALNPTASFVRTTPGRSVVPIFTTDSPSAETPWLAGGVGLSPHRHSHGDGVASVSLLLEFPLSWPGLAAWIDHLRERYGADLLRCKGLLNMAGSSGPVVLHGVQTAFDTIRLPLWPDTERRSRITLIGRDLDRAEVERSLCFLAGG